MSEDPSGSFGKTADFSEFENSIPMTKEGEIDPYALEALKLEDLKYIGSLEKAQAIYQAWRKGILDPNDPKKKWQFTDVREIASSNITPDQLYEVTKAGQAKGLTRENANEAIIRSLAIASSPLLASPRTLKKKRLGIRTGIRGFDASFGGMVKERESVLYWGEANTGKSQITFIDCVASEQEVPNGLREKGADYHDICWFDTEGNCEDFFDEPEIGINEQGEMQYGESRAEVICNRFGVDYEKFLDHFKLTVMASLQDQLTRMKVVLDAVSKFNFKVIVLDSVIAQVRAEFRNGRQELPDRSKCLAYICSMLHKMKTYTNGIIIATDQVSTIPDVTYGGIAVQPVGGNIIKHFFNQNFYLRREGDHWIGTMVDSNNRPTMKLFPYTITSRGIEDYELTKISPDRKKKMLDIPDISTPLTTGVQASNEEESEEESEESAEEPMEEPIEEQQSKRKRKKTAPPSKE